MKYRKPVTHYDTENLLTIFSFLIIIIIRHSLLELFQNVIGVRFFFETQCTYLYSLQYYYQYQCHYCNTIVITMIYYYHYQLVVRIASSKLMLTRKPS